MFGSGHPQPPHRKEVAMQIVQQQRKSFASTELTVDMPDASRVAPPPDDLSIRFSVAYTLGEYLSMVREHTGFLLRHAVPEVRRRRVLVPLALGTAACVLALAALLADASGWMSGLLLAAAALAFGSLPGTVGFWVVLLATPFFLLKKRRMPVCDFTIDRTVIARRSKAGECRRGWDEVKGVRSYSRGYLVLFERGAVPIPFRCLDAVQLERLRGFALGRSAAGGITLPA
ncbi:hypothetical protein [Massilia phyllosphaerae]|uniref:hypothetical protein n=1 Tax=Massilia phyllosphaerae TaxID=3106034 RepID=UPI002B1CD61F|nr:hypothetical protein [Massilia sp. SGZ-792]